MSADNGIYVLKTCDKMRQVDEGFTTYVKGPKGPGRVTAYRVAHAQAIDNFDWYCDREPHNLGLYLNDVWGKSPIFYDRNEAWEYAQKLYMKADYVEYGVSEIDASEYNFPGY